MKLLEAPLRVKVPVPSMIPRFPPMLLINELLLEIDPVLE